MATFYDVSTVKDPYKEVSQPMSTMETPTPSAALPMSTMETPTEAAKPTTRRRSRRTVPSRVLDPVKTYDPVKERVVTQEQFKAETETFASVLSKQGVEVYKRGEEVVGYYDSSTKERVTTKGFHVDPSAPEPLTKTQKFIKSPVAFAASKIKPEISFEEAYERSTTGNPLYMAMVGIEESVQKLSWGKLPHVVPTPIGIVPTEVVKGTTIGFTAGATDIVKSPVKTIATLGVGYGAGRVVAATVPLGAAVKATPAVQAMLRAAPSLPLAAKGIKIGATVGAVGIVGGAVALEVGKSEQPYATLGVVAKDFTIFGGAYTWGYGAQTKAQAAAVARYAQRKGAKTLLEAEKGALTYEYVKPRTTEVVGLTEEEYLAQRSLKEFQTGLKTGKKIPDVRVSELQIKKELVGKDTLTGKPIYDYPSTLKKSVVEIPGVKIYETSAIVPPETVKIFDVKTGKVLIKPKSALADLYTGEEGRFFLIHERPPTPVTRMELIKPTPIETQKELVGFMGKKGQVYLTQQKKGISVFDIVRPSVTPPSRFVVENLGESIIKPASQIKFPKVAPVGLTVPATEAPSLITVQPTLPKPIALEAKPSTITDTIAKEAAIVAVSEDVTQIPRTKFSETTKTSSVIKSDIAADIAQAQEISPVTDVVPDITTIQQSKIKFDSRTGFEPITRTFEPTKPTEFVPLPIGFPDFRKDKQRGGVDVLVRRFGKFEKVNVNGLTFESAERLGRKVLRTTAAASFKIVGEAGKVFPVKSFGAGFRPSTKEFGVVIQKRGFRIGTAGEKREITFKGIEAQRKGKKKKRRGLFL